MTARYLVRFDDICSTMNWEVWDRVEQLLIQKGVTPILAVIPDNQDPSLATGSHNEEFWVRVREWQARGWTIGWHGYRHLYDSKCAGLVGINRLSEFAGHTRELQLERLHAALAIFKSHAVRPDVWVAPAHSFDRVTVELLGSLGIRLISDGFYLRPLAHLGSLWIPQQLWTFRWVPFGLWTVCCHINSWSDEEIEAFGRDLAVFADRLTALDEVRKRPFAARKIVDRSFEVAFRYSVLLRRAIRGMQLRPSRVAESSWD